MTGDILTHFVDIFINLVDEGPLRCHKYHDDFDIRLNEMFKIRSQDIAKPSDVGGI